MHILLSDQVSRTNPQQPSMSLLQQVCYPKTTSFKSTATTYGCAHEKEALEQYKAIISPKHTGFNVKQCGLFLDEDHPYLGASPDALVECTCCGLGVVEVKCPWCARDAESLDELAGSSNFCLIKLPDGSLQLSKSHQYYHQCQLQMHVTHRTYCDFIVWHTEGLHVERLSIDQQLLQQVLPKAKQFFRMCILPELAGKWFTRSKGTQKANTTDKIVEDDDNGNWCFCNESKGGVMIACDNRRCSIKWFHTSCLDMQEPPAGKWSCPTCCQKKKKS